MAKRRDNTNKVALESPTKRVQEFNLFWDGVYEQIPMTAKQKKLLKEQPAEFRLKTEELDKHATQFHEFSKKVAVTSAIRAWMEETLAEAHWKERYAKSFAALYKKNLIPLFDDKGDLVTLEYFEKEGHQDILEAIRSVDDWSLLEREEILRVYVQFSESLARKTRGLIPAGFDPDRERVQQKAVSYETFIDLIPHLSERDALIAKLLYFCDVAMEEILTLKKSALNKSNHSLQLDSGIVQMPRHLFMELVGFIQSSGGSQKLVFTNVRGEQVDRTHLNQSLARACEKSIKKEKITPGALLKRKSERDLPDRK